MIKAKFHLNQQAIDRTKKRLDDIGRSVKPHKLSVGIHEAEGAAMALGYDGKPGDSPLVDVAADHEFGAGSLPERSWLRTWFDQNVTRLKQESKDAMIAERKGDASGVERLDAKWRDELKEWIETGYAALESLAPSTAAERQKQGLPTDPPLFATGQLVRSIRGMLDGSYIG